MSDEGVGTFVPWSPGKPGGPGWVIAENGCHIWTGARNGGRYAVAGVPGRRATTMVHRLRYEREVGPIPEGLHLDHYVCDNGPGGCCNPHHCRPVTQWENNLRSEGLAARNAAKTHCLRGHPLSGDNLHPSNLKRGERACRACARVRKLESMPPRRWSMKGDGHPSSRLTAERVREVRLRLSRGEACGAIGTEFGVSVSTIRDVRDGRTWRSV